MSKATILSSVLYPPPPLLRRLTLETREFEGESFGGNRDELRRGRGGGGAVAGGGGKERAVANYWQSKERSLPLR
jgi:hypothetical protein